MINKFGDKILTTNDVIDILYNEKTELNDLNITDVNEITKYNNALTELFLDLKPLSKYIEPDISVEEFDEKNQQEWNIPDSYKDMDIAKYILDKCPENQEALQRTGQELLEFQKMNFFNILIFLKYMVDVMRENNIVWGVGRGSSASSYVLYLLGLHKIDSLHYDLDFNDFIKK